MSAPTIDLNCDLGEGGIHDADLMQWVTSVNIACGGHAGDESTMRQTVALARVARVSIGAHPGFEDRENFGRTELQLPAAEVFALVKRQVERLRRVAGEAECCLSHVKPHGALYNLAARDSVTARGIAEAVASIDPQLILVGLANSELIEAGRVVGLAVAAEGFVDRRYEADGSLVSRSISGAVIEDIGQAVDQAQRMVIDRNVVAWDGSVGSMNVDTLCLHGDGPDPVAFARHLHSQFLAQGIQLRPLNSRPWNGSN